MLSLLGTQARAIRAKVDEARYEAGYAAGCLAKAAGKPSSVYALSGRLYLSSSGWLLLDVPNAVARGLFAALDVPGVELPPGRPDFNAHISVATASELSTVDVSKISERGKRYRYQIGPIKTVKPEGWREMSAVYFAEIVSPDLKEFRKTLGLSPLPNGDHPFHLTIAVRRKGVALPNTTSKAAAAPRFVRIKVDAGDGKHMLHHYITADSWDHPAGRIESGEHPRAAAARELKERTGHEVDPADLTEAGSEGSFAVFTVPLAKTRKVGEPGAGGGYAARIKFAALKATNEPEIVIDRPKGYTKKFNTKNGPLQVTYPVDYGYLKGLINPQDGEDADVFVGSGGLHFGRYMKGNTTTGTWQPDEHKWYTGLNDHELAAMHKFWHDQDPALIQDHVRLASHAAVVADVRSMQQRATKTGASTNTSTMPDGRVLDIDRLLTATRDRPTEQIAVRDLARPNRSSNTGFSKSRYASVAMDEPVLVGPDGTLHDGRHRLARHLDEGRNDIKARRLTSADLEAAYLKRAAAYQEEPGSSFTHDGDEYDLNALLKLTADRPVKARPVSRLKWVLDEAKQDTDPGRLARADLKTPVLVAFDQRHRPTVVDGHHRLTKAVQQGQGAIRGIEVMPEDMAAVRIGPAKKEAGTRDAYANSSRTDEHGKPCPPGECCPHCRARLERGDNGDCNHCGEVWPDGHSKLAILKIAAGLGKSVWDTGRKLLGSTVGRSVAGAGAGLAVGAGEVASGVADPNMSAEGQMSLLGANALAGAALANPRARRALFTRPAYKAVATSGSVPHYIRQDVPAVGRILAGARLGLGLPKLTNATDVTARVARTAQDAWKNNPDALRAVTNPSDYTKEVVTNTATKTTEKALASPAAQAAGSAFGRTFGAGLAGVGGGGLVGNLAGGSLGKLLQPDDEHLDYADRRRRERNRTLLTLAGTGLGAAAGGYALPRLIPDASPSK